MKIIRCMWNSEGHKMMTLPPQDKFHKNPNDREAYYEAAETSIKTITLMMPTKVDFIIKMPSVKMEIAWVSLATFNKEKEVNEALLIKDPSLLWEAKIIGNSSERAKPREQACSLKAPACTCPGQKWGSVVLTTVRSTGRLSQKMFNLSLPFDRSFALLWASVFHTLDESRTQWYRWYLPKSKGSWRYWKGNLPFTAVHILFKQCWETLKRLTKAIFLS